MRYATQEVVLRDIDSFVGAEYNPRKMIPERLEQVKSSLAKLGFVLPIYVNKNNVILSGHQRTTAAKLYGYTKVPVVEVDVPDSQEKGINIVFNKGTNDMDTYAGDAKSAFVEYLETASGLIQSLPDIPPDTFYPCMQYQQWPLARALEMAGDVNSTMRGAGWLLLDSKISMPLVVSESGKMLNGKGRAYGYSGHNYDQVDVVVIPDSHADYAYMALNFLAMDFKIQENFEDELRYNAFRRRSVQQQIVGLSRTYPYFVYNRVISNTAQKYALLEGQGNPDLMLLPQSTETARKKFQDTYGHVIYDMGAGTLWDAMTMQKAGFDCVPFEPFFCDGGNEPVPSACRALLSKFLDHMDGHQEGPDSIISSFVLNSIPHHKDRMAYLTILAAIAKVKTGVYVGTQSVKTLNDNLASHLRLNSAEPNVTLGNDTRFFKAQKFYYVEELEKILKTFFTVVDVKAVQSNLFAKCKYPKRINATLLGEALDLEFNMPYRDGSHLELHHKAREVFAKYLNMPELLLNQPNPVVEA
jgi:hypothetical protein